MCVFKKQKTKTQHMIQQQQQTITTGTRKDTIHDTRPYFFLNSDWSSDKIPDVFTAAAAAAACRFCVRLSLSTFCLVFMTCKVAKKGYFEGKIGSKHSVFAPSLSLARPCAAAQRSGRPSPRAECGSGGNQRKSISVANVRGCRNQALEDRTFCF